MNHQRLRVAHCSMPTHGGVHHYIIELMKRQDDYQLYVICPDDGFLARDAQKVGATVIPINMTRDISLTKDLAAIHSLYQVFRDGQFDVIHLHSAKAGFLGRIAAFLAGAKAVIYQPHGWPFKMTDPRRWLWFLLEYCAAPLATKIICISQSDKVDALQYGVAREKKLAVILNGIDIERFVEGTNSRARSRIELGIASDDIVVGFIGRLATQKAPDVLIHAAKRMHSKNPRIKVLLIGDGPMYGEVRTLISSMSLDENVLLLGWRDDVAPLLEAIDIGVVPSRWEGFGLVAAEFMAAGCPVVATKVDGLVEVVVDAETGLLVAPDNAEELASAICLLAENAELRDKLGQAAQRRARELFDVNRMAAQVNELYTAVMSTGR